MVRDDAWTYFYVRSRRVESLLGSQRASHLRGGTGVVIDGISAINVLPHWHLFSMF